MRHLKWYDLVMIWLFCSALVTPIIIVAENNKSLERIETHLEIGLTK